MHVWRDIWEGYVVAVRHPAKTARGLYDLLVDCWYSPWLPVAAAVAAVAVVWLVL